MALAALIIALVVLLVTTYVWGERNVASPAILFLAAWTVSSLLALVNQVRWHYQLSWFTVAIIVGGAIEFVVVSMLVKWAFERWFPVRKDLLDRECEREPIPVVMLLLVDLVMAVCLAVYIGGVLSMVPRGGSVGVMLRNFKAATSVTGQQSLPGYVLQLFRLLQMLGYSLSFVAAIHIATGRWRRRSEWLRTLLVVVGIGINLLAAFFSSDRLAMMSIGLSVVVLALVLYQFRSGREGLTRRGFLFAALGMVAAFLGFFAIAPLVGRNISGGPLGYLAVYGGASVQLLDAFLLNPPPRSPVFGMESLYTFNLKRFLSGQLPGMDHFPPIHLEFRSHNDNRMGNVYSAYRRWIQDFGILGAALVNLIMALVMNVIFRLVSRGRGFDRPFWFVVYGWMAYMVVMHPIDAYFTVQGFSMSFVASLLILKLISVLVLRLHVTRSPFSVSIEGRPCKWERR